jgi:hypothetical protein
MRKLPRLCPLLLFAMPAILLALAVPDVSSRIATLAAPTKSAQSAGDNAWMLYPRMARRVYIRGIATNQNTKE